MGDQDVLLGDPIGDVEINNQQVYIRYFENGVVIVNPWDKGDGNHDYWKNRTGRTVYDIDGKWAGFTVDGRNAWVRDGEARILLYSENDGLDITDTRYDRLIDFEQNNHWGGYFENALIENVGVRHF